MLRLVKRICVIVSWALAVVSAGVGGIARMTAPPSGFSVEQWEPVRAWAVKNQVWFLVGLPIVMLTLNTVPAWVAAAQQKRIRDEQLRGLLARALARLRREFIPERLRNDPETDHRLTVFRADHAQTKLEIVARSSEATSGSETVWTIHPDVLGRCQGVAGIAWFQNHTVIVPAEGAPDLPDVSQPAKPSKKDVTDYAEGTFVTPEQVREHRWRARSYAAISIRRSDGRKWGVLVLDSVDSRGATEENILKVRFTADMLGDIISAWGDL